MRAVYARDNWIDVIDQGTGMSLIDLDQVFLTIGTRSRRADNMTGARYLGDKGVGRLSAMRLGDRLLVRSAPQSQPFWGRLRINWDLFSHDRDTPIEDIKITPVASAPKGEEHGTWIRISALTGDWTPARFDDVVQGKIARMIDPFGKGGNNLLRVRHNGRRVLVPVVPRKLLEAAHATCRVRFHFETDVNGRSEPVLEADMNYHLRHKSRPVRYRGAEIFELAQKSSKRRGKRGHAAFENIRITPTALTDLGPFEAEIYWFNRLIVQAIDGLTNGQQGTRDEIKVWSGGPMLYRHGFRILPYGEPNDDWLALDTNAFGEGGFKLNRQQVVGRVLINASHLALSEQTNRQGLIESDAEAALRKMLMVILHVDLRGLINDADDAEAIAVRRAEESAMDFRGTLGDVEQALAALKERLTSDQLPFADHLDERVHTLAAQCTAIVRKLDQSVAETAEDREKFLHLAGIGLMTEFIFHELDRAVKYTMSVLADARLDQREAAMRALADQLQTLEKRVSAFDELTGERRQTKSRFDMAEVVKSVLAAHEAQFERHGIELNLALPALPVRAVRGMVIQILENLIANAVYWLKAQVQYEPGFKPALWVSLDPQLKTLTVEDNGPGVDPSRKELIFNPFVSSKPPQQGRGLGLYISREMAQYHSWALYMDDLEGRHRDGRLSLFVLDMDETK